jgi:hypothetical protein
MLPRTRWGGRQAFILKMAGSIPAGSTKIRVGCHKVWQRIVNPSGKPTAGSIPARPTITSPGSSVVERMPEEHSVGSSILPLGAIILMIHCRGCKTVKRL